MARIDFTSQRLFVDAPLARDVALPLDRQQANYLLNVLRFSEGDPLLIFNGQNGEWRATLAATGRKAAILHVVEQTREQTVPSRIHYCFAPLKHARLDYVVQKAVEMGAGVLHPVMTRHTQVSRINLERMRANAIEAAEQCGILAVPTITEERKFEAWLADWPSDHLIIFCDEDADHRNALGIPPAGVSPTAPVGVLLGPEGGFAEDERQALLALPNVMRLWLGPRILRADTAAVAALTLVQAALGDWRIAG
ncbi:16S rRNA (uracil(1498)-N(3))-methyltransferase [Lichenihabitans psoromatis]|uniref:16S rRNA (uracil(1498)-N(3))-methyltransferase n=1 Tax=Lichenihabitans psoromatis TaxID=2528642 RepID=UPI0010385B28|nr:16S rRNA (uracil(1498)-N(3))-methyltransferase [Lichenihabitans psoromatis]